MFKLILAIYFTTWLWHLEAFIVWSIMNVLKYFVKLKKPRQF
jgi:hypothetical protein